MVAAAAQSPVTPSTPITVTGHQWAPFISPMGEPFRAHSATDDPLANWFSGADQNHDGVLTTDEMEADAQRYFSTLDLDHDGEIGPDEIAHYEYEVAPEIQVMSKTRRAPGQPAPIARKSDTARESSRDRRKRLEEEYANLGLGGALQGGARYALLNIPEPVAAADADFNRGVSLEEFRAAARARFQLLDSARQGRLSLAQLEALRPVLPANGKRPKPQKNARDKRIGNPLPPGS